MNLIDAKSWADEMDVSVTVCDLKGIVVYMNQSSVLGFHKYGGADLIGKSLIDCHNPQSQQKIGEMLEYSHTNTYVTVKENEKKIIRQFPWVEDGQTKGIIELSFKLPVDLEIKNH